MSLEDKLQFPDELIVCLVEEVTSRPVPNIVLTLTLYAKKKNDYHFGPSLSDSSGTIVIERDWVRQAIVETINFFVMDYYSTIDHCYPYIDLKVDSPDDIRREINAREQYVTVKEGELGVLPSIADLRNASNYDYESQTIRVTLDTSGETMREVVIRLRRRKV